MRRGTDRARNPLGGGEAARYPRPPVIPERLQPLLDETAELAARFTAGGHRLYLVGGIVRDLVLNRVTAELDLDFTTDARPEEIEAMVAGWADAMWLQGKRFGTVGVKKGDRRMEITTHRAEAYVPDSRKPEVEFSDEISIDLSR